MKPVLSVVLGSYNRKRFLRRTLESVRNNGIPVPYEIIVVDGGSTDGSAPWLARQKDVITIVQHNRGTWRGKPLERRSWGYFMNLGFKAAQGEYICMVSDDCLLVPGAIANGLKRFETERAKGRKIGAVAFYWRNWPEEREYCVGLTLGDKMFVNHGLYLREAMAEVGYCEEEAYRFYHADGDLCLKMWERGYECIDSPGSFVEHFSHANMVARQANLERQQADWAAYLERWTGIYYDGRSEETGSWLRRAHDDPSRTANGFPSPRPGGPVRRVRRLLAGALRRPDRSAPKA
jgi:glycosyltransferase involved in cell wall biosynthesis